MNTYFTVYDAQGKILRNGFCPTNMLEVQAKENEFIIGEESDPSIHYVANGTVLLRPIMPITVAGLVLSNVPANSLLWIEGESYPCSGNVTLSFEFPGTYPVRVECFPYLDFNLEVTV